MDTDSDSETDPNSSNDYIASPNRQSVLEGFLSRLFGDRFLSPRSTSEPSPQTAPAIQIPFFAADSVFTSAQTSAITSTSSGNTLAADAPMGSQPEDLVFCPEDTVGLKDDKYSVGVVDRSFGDVDSHAPRPQKDYEEDIERHGDISREDFSKFMRSGIPPRGTVMVSWQTKIKTELIPESKLQLLDRALYVGDVVKKNSKDPMSGTVIGTKAVCTLFPAIEFNGGTLTHAMTEDLSIRNIPAEELINVHEYAEGALVVYGDWVGRIEQVFDEVAVKLSNNSVVVVEDPEDLVHDDTMLDRHSVGDSVQTKKGNLRRGRWKYGVFDPNVRPQGTIVETRPVSIDVHWLTRRIGVGNPGGNSQEPSPRLYRDDLDNANFHVYDASGSAAATLPLAIDGTDRSYHVADVTVGDRVRFKDLGGAAVKYDGSKKLPNGYPQGKLTRIPRTDTLGYDMNVFLIMQTHTQVTVQWQDLTVTDDTSTSLIPDPNVDDDDEVWPGEIVCTKDRKEGNPVDDMKWTFTPVHVGMVQTVRSRDRIAKVRWFKDPIIQFLGDDLIPPSVTGELCEGTEDVSLYDIRSTPSVTRRRGDFVLVHPDAVNADALPSDLQGPSWFGEVIDLGIDGKVTVRLGAAKPVVDVRISIESVTLAYSSDMRDHMDGLEDDSDDDYESLSAGDDDFDSASFNEMWIEYEGMDGEANGGNEEDWSTENDEDSDDDKPMPDLVTREEPIITNTTPELHSNADQKATPAAGNTGEQDTVMLSPTAENSEPVTNTTTATPADLPPSFHILSDEPPENHHFITQSTSTSTAFMRRIGKEHKILRTSLPPDIFVRTWDSRLDLIRVLIVGPSDTPYEYAPFVIDFHLPSTYPQEPPSAFFHSWTYGNGPVNPNLYEDGKICLSLLGTWHADERNEGWNPTKSTLLQLLVSIIGLVLVKEPYYNEAGYDVHRSAPETKLSSALYSERAYFRARAFIAHALTHGMMPFAAEFAYLYKSQTEGAPRLLDKAIDAARGVLERSTNENDSSERDGLRKISLGATVMLKREMERLEGLRREQSG